MTPGIQCLHSNDHMYGNKDRQRLLPPPQQKMTLATIERRRTRQETRRAPLQLLLCFSFAASAASHKHADSFPPNDEYDFAILDPDTQFGSPFGGFGRATASRLASLPLHLPNVGISLEELLEEDDPMHVRVRDARGRQFACRTYHEDQMNPDTLHDSLFDIVQFKSTEVELADPQLEPETDAAMDDASIITPPAIGASKSDDPYADALATVNARLLLVTGMCAQSHTGWWSYEWCHEGSMSQFHVEIQKGNQYGVSDVTNLGSFHERDVQVFQKGQKIEDISFSEGRPELAIVKDAFHGGDVCAETGEPRETHVTMRCCSQAKIDRSKGGVLLEGRPVMTDLVSIVDVYETKDEVCKYNVNVCTPLLCADYKENGPNAPGSAKQGTHLKMSAGKSTVSVEDLGVREALDVIFGKTRRQCVQSELNGGWWIYELCHGEKIRQYHETTNVDPMTGVTKTVIDDQYILGKYDASVLEQFPKEEEGKFVVNSTSISGGSAGDARASNKEVGNGAYFTQEYTNGDVCQDPDVTDSAITAGAAGGKGIERAATVRYMCGLQFHMSVKEDSTCHYIVEVTLPALCQHPLFKAPTSKMEVLKCLPVVPAGVV